MFYKNYYSSINSIHRSDKDDNFTVLSAVFSNYLILIFYSLIFTEAAKISKLFSISSFLVKAQTE